MRTASWLPEIAGFTFIMAGFFYLAGCAGVDQSSTASSPTDKTQTLYFGRNASKVMAQERTKGAEKIEAPWTDHMMVSFATGRKIEGATVFGRTYSDFKPTPYVTYYHTREDSVLWRADYMWDASRNGQYLLQRGVCNHRPGREAFERRYRQLRDRLVSRFGEPTKKKAIHRDTLSGHVQWERSDEWKSDSLEVHLRLTFGAGIREVDAGFLWKQPLQGNAIE